MKDTIYGLDNESYHNSPPYSDYVSSTDLKLYLQSPKHYRYIQDHPQPQTDAMRFGSLFHDLMASCAEHYDNGTQAIGEWMSRIAVFEPPKNDKTGQPYGNTTKTYKEHYEAFLQANEDKTIASRDDLSQIQQIAMSLLFDCGSTTEQVRKLLKWGKPEVSVFYETEEGIKLKVRPDLLTSNKIIDWKTVALDDLTEESINRTILKFGYHISGAMYQWVCHKVYGKWFTFILVFIQKQPPYDCVMVDMSNYGYRYIAEWDMVQTGPGAMEFQKLLDLHTRCTKENRWPGAETFIPGDKYRILEIEPPRYYSQKFLEE